LAKGTQIIAAYSREMGRAEAFAEKHNIDAAYDSVDDLLGDSRIDAVFIATPNHLHAPQTRKSAEAKKHVLVEKPMTVHMTEALEMVRTCRKHEVRLGVGFQLRHHPGHLKARQLVQDGILGKISLAHTQFFHLDARGVVERPSRSPLSKWWEAPEMLGGPYPLMGMGVHAIDLMQFLLAQPITEVAAVDGGHAGTIAVRFEGGAIGSVCYGSFVPDTRNDAVIYGSDGRISAVGTLWEALDGTLEVVSESVNITVPYDRNLLTLYKLQTEAFNRAVHSGETFLASDIDGLSSVQVASAVIESAAFGRSVKIEPIRDQII
ncbi:MAG: Gfo/Idh/MocA family oxidoreductase, partial [Planctomycetota bacterium]